MVDTSTRIIAEAETAILGRAAVFTWWQEQGRDGLRAEAGERELREPAHLLF